MLRLKVQLTLVLIAALVWQSEAWWSRRSTRRTSSSVCPNPPTGFGAMQTGCGWPYEEGETCEFVCRDGYRRTSGDTSRNCNGGTWTGETLVCEYTGCGRLPYSPGAWRTGCYWPYTDGENCTFYCGEGYIEVSGNYTVTCQDGTWSGTPLTCEYTGCEVPEEPSSGVRRKDCWWPFANGENCTYFCVRGHSEVSGDSTVTCRDGAWSGTPLTCEYTGCERPPLTSGSWSPVCWWPYENGKECTYTCRDGHSPVSGNSTITCVDGAWSGTPLECIRTAPGCNPPPVGRRYGTWGPRRCRSPYEEGETCTLSCLRGYQQESGDTSTTCTGGQWTGEPLVCTGRGRQTTDG
ncbi:P-selectin-like [Branchiostoma floridae x Branchiostoma belcheri]